MTFEEIIKTLEATVLTKCRGEGLIILSACASDLMSDVLAFSKPKSILITGLATAQTIRTAEVADLLAVCFVFGKRPVEETIRLGDENEIPMISSPFSLYTASGLLYQKGLGGCLELR